jgi:hypothetical protein
MHRTHLKSDFISKPGTFLLCKTFKKALANPIKQTLLALDSTNSGNGLLFPVTRIRVIRVNVTRRVYSKIRDELRELGKLE